MDELAPGTEVLLRSGVSPLDVERVPSGARLEFVAVADGFAPRRGVIPAGATWETATGKPRYDLAIQLERSRARAGSIDPWPPTEPGSLIGGVGPAGTVHILTSPRGAEVWMLAGQAPQAKIDGLACGGSVELLLAGASDGQPFRRRLRVDPSQFTRDLTGTPTARVSARLAGTE